MYWEEAEEATGRISKRLRHDCWHWTVSEDLAGALGSSFSQLDLGPCCWVHLARGPTSPPKTCWAVMLVHVQKTFTRGSHLTDARDDIAHRHVLPAAPHSPFPTVCFPTIERFYVQSFFLRNSSPHLNPPSLSYKLSFSSPFSHTKIRSTVSVKDGWMSFSPMREV